MCTLRISGRDLDVDALLRVIPLRAAAVHRRGEPRRSRTRPDGPRREFSNINVSVSDADFSDLPAQVADAQAFLHAHAAHLRDVRAFPGVEGMEFDFAVELREVAVQSDCFPAQLLLAMGSLGIDLEVTLYPGSE